MPRYLFLITGTATSVEDVANEQLFLSSPNLFTGRLFGWAEQGMSLAGIDFFGYSFPTGTVPSGLEWGQIALTATDAGRQAIIQHYQTIGTGFRLASVEILDDGTYGVSQYWNVTERMGTAAPNRLVGTATIEELFGGAGADTILGGEGSGDWLYGGSGNDRLFAGDDVKNAGLSVDRLFGGLGDDFIKGSFSGDLLVGGAGNDVLLGNGKAASSTTAVQDGADYVYGGLGDDLIDTRVGNGGDHLFGGDGNDTISANANGDSTIYGGNGRDLISGHATGDLTGNFLREIRGGSGRDTIEGAGNLYGDEGADVIRINHLPNAIPDDIVFGGGGKDVLVVGGFDVNVWGGTETDRFILKLMDFGGLAEYANVIIHDFEKGVEKVDLTRLPIASFSDLSAVSYTSFGLYRTLFSWNAAGQSVDVEIVHARGVQITADDFIFA